MKKWIRWKGFLAFVAAVVLLVLIWVLVVDAMVQRTIEIVGTRAVGARVDLAEADLSLFPMGLMLNGLAVTNPDSPMQNAVEIDRLKMDLDPGYLIRRKVVINDMVLEGLRFNTPRTRSGEVPGLAKKETAGGKTDLSDASKAAVEKVCGEFTMPSLSQPDIKSILSKESLDALTMAADLENRLRSEQARWEKELKQLPDEKKLNAYGERIEKLKRGKTSLGGILGSARELNQLQADVQKDLNLLKKAQTTLSTDVKGYQAQVRDLANAANKDIQRLMDKYSLSPKGLANLSQLVFGEKLCGWVQTAWDWYRKIKPYMDRASKDPDGTASDQAPLRGKGRDIRFAETPPMPDFLIRVLKANAELDAGNLTGKIENLTFDQRLLGKPMTFAFSGKEMKQMAALSLAGTADRVNPGDPKTSARLAIKGLGIQDLVLVDQASFPLTLQKAIGDVNLNLEAAGEDFDADIKADFGKVRFVADAGEGEGQAAMAKAIGSALSGVDRFALKATAAGTLAEYAVALSSDLDQVLKSAVGNLVKAEAAKLETALREQITAKLKDPTAKTKAGLADLGGIETELRKRLNLGDNLLKEVKFSL